jgi:hypothetical protein
MVFVTFDTYEHIERLKGVGLNEKQAKAIVDTVKLSHFEFATKHDLDLLAQKLDQLATKDELNQFRLETRESFAQVDAKVANFKTEIIRWMVGLFFAQTGLLLALLKFAR